MADPDYQYSDSESDFEVDLADSPRQKSPQQIRENMADIGRRRVTHLDGDDLAVLGTSIIDEGFSVNLLFRPDPSNPRRSLCTGRNCTYGGDMGATRQRAHILGISNRDVRACKSVPTRVVWKGVDRKLDTMAIALSLAWSVDVQCDTCQLNIMSGFPEVAYQKVALHHTVALTELASRSLLVKVYLKKKSGGRKTRR